MLSNSLILELSEQLTFVTKETIEKEELEPEDCLHFGEWLHLVNGEEREGGR